MSAGDRSLLDVGRIIKAHGIRGEVAVLCDVPERMYVDATFETDKGELVVERVKPFQQGYLVKFRSIADRNEAELWRGVVLRGAPRESDGDDIWIHELFDATVVTTDDVVRGVVVSVEENPASDLLVLDTGYLVPLAFVTELTPNERIVVDAPEGLFE